MNAENIYASLVAAELFYSFGREIRSPIECRLASFMEKPQVKLLTEFFADSKEFSTETIVACADHCGLQLDLTYEWRV
jgi:hypothetical protein